MLYYSIRKKIDFDHYNIFIIGAKGTTPLAKGTVQLDTSETAMNLMTETKSSGRDIPHEDRLTSTSTSTSTSDRGVWERGLGTPINSDKPYNYSEKVIDKPLHYMDRDIRPPEPTVERQDNMDRSNSGGGYIYDKSYSNADRGWNKPYDNDRGPMDADRGWNKPYDNDRGPIDADRGWNKPYDNDRGPMDADRGWNKPYDNDRTSLERPFPTDKNWDNRTFNNNSDKPTDRSYSMKERGSSADKYNNNTISNTNTNTGVDRGWDRPIGNMNMNPNDNNNNNMDDSYMNANDRITSHPYSNPFERSSYHPVERPFPAPNRSPGFAHRSLSDEANRTWGTNRPDSYPTERFGRQSSDGSFEYSPSKNIAPYHPLPPRMPSSQHPHARPHIKYPINSNTTPRGNVPPGTGMPPRFASQSQSHPNQISHKRLFPNEGQVQPPPPPGNVPPQYPPRSLSTPPVRPGGSYYARPPPSQITSTYSGPSSVFNKNSMNEIQHQQQQYQQQSQQQQYQQQPQQPQQQHQYRGVIDNKEGVTSSSTTVSTSQLTSQAQPQQAKSSATSDKSTDDPISYSRVNTSSAKQASSLSSMDPLKSDFSEILKGQDNKLQRPATNVDTKDIPHHLSTVDTSSDCMDTSSDEVSPELNTSEEPSLGSLAVVPSSTTLPTNPSTQTKAPQSSSTNLTFQTPVFRAPPARPPINNVPPFPTQNPPTNRLSQGYARGSPAANWQTDKGLYQQPLQPSQSNEPSVGNIRPIPKTGGKVQDTIPSMGGGKAPLHQQHQMSYQKYLNSQQVSPALNSSINSSNQQQQQQQQVTHPKSVSSSSPPLPAQPPPPPSKYPPTLSLSAAYVVPVAPSSTIVMASNNDISSGGGLTNTVPNTSNYLTAMSTTISGQPIAPCLGGDIRGIGVIRRTNTPSVSSAGPMVESGATSSYLTSSGSRGSGIGPMASNDANSNLSGASSTVSSQYIGSQQLPSNQQTIRSKTTPLPPLPPPPPPPPPPQEQQKPTQSLPMSQGIPAPQEKSNINSSVISQVSTLSSIVSTVGNPSHVHTKPPVQSHEISASLTSPIKDKSKLHDYNDSTNNTPGQQSNIQTKQQKPPLQQQQQQQQKSSQSYTNISSNALTSPKSTQLDKSTHSQTSSDKNNENFEYAASSSYIELFGHKETVTSNAISASIPMPNSPLDMQKLPEIQRHESSSSVGADGGSGSLKGASTVSGGSENVTVNKRKLRWGQGMYF